MNKYRKKPVVIEAVKFVYSDKGINELAEFCGDALGDIIKERRMDALAEATIKTLEDGSKHQVKHIATEGDYIIKGIRGEFYPCKPDIFEQTYELVTDEQKQTENAQRNGTLEGTSKESQK